MKILNLSIEIIHTTKNIESIYMSRRPDFITKLINISELTQ